MAKEVRVVFDDGQETPVGRFLGTMMYNTGFLQSLRKDQYTGCPHHGGMHALTINDTIPDLIAWLELVEEECEKLNYIEYPKPEMDYLISKLKDPDYPKKGLKLRQMLLNAIQVEINHMSGTCHVNSVRGCIGRFNLNGWEITDRNMQQVKSSCQRGSEPFSQRDFERFRAAVYSEHGYRIPLCHQLFGDFDNECAVQDSDKASS